MRVRPELKLHKSRVRHGSADFRAYCVRILIRKKLTAFYALSAQKSARSKLQRKERRIFAFADRLFSLVDLRYVKEAYFFQHILPDSRRLRLKRQILGRSKFKANTANFRAIPPETRANTANSRAIQSEI